MERLKKTIAPKLLHFSSRQEKTREKEREREGKKTHLHCARFRQREFVVRAMAGRQRRRVRTESFIRLPRRGRYTSGASTSKRGTISCALSDREARRRVTTSPLIIMPHATNITSRCSIFTPTARMYLARTYRRRERRSRSRFPPPFPSGPARPVRTAGRLPDEPAATSRYAQASLQPLLFSNSLPACFLPIHGASSAAPSTCRTHARADSRYRSRSEQGSPR